MLVERVEGFATQEEWMRAYDEINDFEKLLTDDHYIIGKFFYHISKDEQLKRFKDREQSFEKMENYRRRLAKPRKMGRVC